VQNLKSLTLREPVVKTLELENISIQQATIVPLALGEIGDGEVP